VCGERGKREKWKERKGKENGKRKKELALCPASCKKLNIHTHTLWHLAGNRGVGKYTEGRGGVEVNAVVFYSEEFTI